MIVFCSNNKILLRLFFFMLFLHASCNQKRYDKSAQTIKKAAVPICIKMPSNSFVFDNISPLLHTALVHHFKRIGYTLVQQEQNGYVLTIVIKNLSIAQNYISPDILPFHANIKLELLCLVHNFAGSQIAQKVFYFSTLISKPINPILNSSFVDFEYKKLCDRSAIKIEQFIRPLLLTDT